MLGWIVPLVIIVAVIAIAVYRNNQKKADAVIEKAEDVVKTVETDVKKV